ncbi:MAG: phosphoribosylanthranilate isomerase [Myxococcota bacterium]
MIEIKICGVTRMADVELCVDLGVEALGLNFWPRSPRCVDADFARRVRDAFPQLELVGVFVNPSSETLRTFREQAGLNALQLHGDESPDFVRAHACAYKAVPVASEADVAHALSFGERILVDAPAGALRGGAGETFDWTLVAGLSAKRHVTLAGGLRSTNVSLAIEVARPARVDVASGVESAPGVKDSAKLRAFVEAVRAHR